VTYPAKEVDGEMTSNPIARNFVEPTVLTDVTTDMVITKREPSAWSRRSTAQDRCRRRQDGQ
jgi:hypothetical protein